MLKRNVNACARLVHGTAHRLLVQLEASVLRLTAVKRTTVANDIFTVHADNLRCSIGVAGANLKGVGWLRNSRTVGSLALDRSNLHTDGTN